MFIVPVIVGRQGLIPSFSHWADPIVKDNEKPIFRGSVSCTLWYENGMKKKMIIAGLLFSMGIMFYGYLETFRVGVTFLTIHNSRLAAVMQGKTVVQISDMHIADIGIREKKVLELLDRIKPDLLFLTGDMIHWRGDISGAMAFLSRLKATDGIYGIMGDYDYSDSRNSCLFCHQEGSGEKTTAHSVQMLKDSAVHLTVNNRKLCILGLDISENDMSSVVGLPSDPSVDEALIVLAHNPLNFDRFNDKDSLMMMAGDTHGGQIPLPSVIWRLLGYRKNERYNDGVFVRGSKTLGVCRGVGYSHVPFRLFCSPEIVVYRFEEN
jgi:predicted MPP superfamily phosphohydrolase